MFGHLTYLHAQCTCYTLSTYSTWLPVRVIVLGHGVGEHCLVDLQAVDELRGVPQHGVGVIDGEVQQVQEVPHALVRGRGRGRGRGRVGVGLRLGLGLGLGIGIRLGLGLARSRVRRV